jgi:hypothetical protein
VVTAIGLLVVFIGVMFTHALPQWYAISITGAAILIYGIYRWAFEPAF